MANVRWIRGWNVRVRVDAEAIHVLKGVQSGEDRDSELVTS